MFDKYISQYIQFQWYSEIESLINQFPQASIETSVLNTEQTVLLHQVGALYRLVINAALHCNLLGSLSGWASTLK